IPGSARTRAHAGHRVRPLRALSRQCTGAGVARRPGRRGSNRRIPGLHGPALASPARVHRPRPDQPPRWRRLGDAPAQPGRDGPAGGRRRLPQGRTADRPLGHLHRVAGRSHGRPMTAPPKPRPWKRALAWLAFLGPFFYLTYGLANASAARRAHVPHVVFDWEHALPFLAWTIVPYWTTNAFYAASPFLCRDRRELDTHCLRLLSVQVLAVACFLAWPLAFSFERPATDGLSGAMFAALEGFDRPYNQAPSLHVALTIILWTLYARHLRGAWRWALHAWFTLVCVSVLTTYQHHFIDIPTGLAAGWLCVWLWPRDMRAPWRDAHPARDAARWRLAALYLAAALGTAAVAVAAGG